MNIGLELTDDIPLTPTSERWLRECEKNLNVSIKKLVDKFIEDVVIVKLKEG